MMEVRKALGPTVVLESSWNVVHYVSKNEKFDERSLVTPSASLE